MKPHWLIRFLPRKWRQDLIYEISCYGTLRVAADKHSRCVMIDGLPSIENDSIAHEKACEKWSLLLKLLGE